MADFCTCPMRHMAPKGSTATECVAEYVIVSVVACVTYCTPSVLLSMSLNLLLSMYTKRVAEYVLLTAH